MSKVKKSRAASRPASKAVAKAAQWSADYDTIRRQNLFQNPPADTSAYPLLRDAVQFHNDAFNALFGRERLIEKGLADIGTKWHRDGELSSGQSEAKNDLRIRVTGAGLAYPELGGTRGAGKAVLPWECRERHVSYRGRMSATLEYTINNGDAVEFEVDLGRVPVMVRVGLSGGEETLPCRGGAVSCGGSHAYGM